jgi:zinc transporter ZupT
VLILRRAWRATVAAVAVAAVVAVASAVVAAAGTYFTGCRRESKD